MRTVNHALEILRYPDVGESGGGYGIRTSISCHLLKMISKDIKKNRQNKVNIEENDRKIGETVE